MQHAEQWIGSRIGAPRAPSPLPSSERWRRLAARPAAAHAGATSPASICPGTSGSAGSTCPSRRGPRRRPTACWRRKPRRSPTTGTPTRCSSSATAARRSSRSRRPAQLIDSMTLAPGGSPQGTEFYDTEGLTYVGGGKFVHDRGARPPGRTCSPTSPGTTLHPRRRPDGQARHDHRQHRPRGRHLRPADRRLHRRQGEASPRASSRPASTSPPAPRPTARRPPTNSTNLFDPALAGLARLLRRLRAVEPAVLTRPRLRATC